jgi:hypothetical protein
LQHEDGLRTEVFRAIEEKKTAVPAILFFLVWFFTTTWAYC